MSATVLKIRLFGDPVLRKKARPIKQITETHRNILSEMARLMYSVSGIGLAAPQVGINESMIVADIGPGLYKLINPKIVKKEGQQILEEGCLSIPGVSIKIKRAKKIKILAQDEFGKPITLEAEGLLACCFQHEVEHLRGRLIIDHAPLLEKLKIRKILAELKRKVKYEEVPESKTESCKLQL